MKAVAVIVSSLFGSALAAPVIVWKGAKRESESASFSSKSVKASSLFGSVVEGSTNSESSLAAAIFLVGRSDNGSEALTQLTSSGSLPGVASKYNDASLVHSHVAGIESQYSVARDVGAGAGAGADSGRKVLEVSLHEFSNKLTALTEGPTNAQMEVDENGMITKAQKDANNRVRALSDADLVIVNVPASTQPSKIDDAVVKAIEHKSIQNVILAGVRSTDEIKYERNMETRRRMKVMNNDANTNNGRRLEQNQNDDANNNNNNDDMSGVYYVHMTPNIFAGILFAFMFAFVTYTGITCMGMIEGQDVYVTKMPTIGREA